MTKVCIIGAGSVVFANRLMYDIMCYTDLEDLHFSLMDINEERLKVAHGFAERMIEKTGAHARVTSTLDRRECLKDANFVINTVQIGGMAATKVDFDIPEKYGIRQTIADTHGVGGILRALRTIPVVSSIAKDMEDLCPQALLINYSNPMAMNVWGVFASTDIQVVGLCHSIYNTARRLAEYLDVEPTHRLKYKAAGINHLCWYLQLTVDGKDMYPKLFERMEDLEIFSKNPVRFEIMRHFGCFVSESSTHFSEYVPYFLQYDEEIARLQIPVQEYIRRCTNIIKRYEENKEMVEGKREMPEWKKSHEYASQIVHSVTTGFRRAIHGNVKNTGLIPNLQQGCCVELKCMVDQHGIQPVYAGPLPPQLAALNRTQISVQELTVQAALEKDREHVYHALLLDPQVGANLRLDKVVLMADEMIEAHGEYLAYLPKPTPRRRVRMQANAPEDTNKLM